MADVNIKSVKHGGQVFTPQYLVKGILDFASYTSGNILRRHVIDNSCGDGAFLCEIVDRYCRDFLLENKGIDVLKAELEEFVHGIEIDRMTCDNCRKNLSRAAKRYGLTDVRWDLTCANALNITSFNGRMDYVVGNPPYVRVHNLEEDYANVKTFGFTQGGMTDLYLAFFELGFNMLGKNGRLCYITPSSWLTSLAATNMRSFIRQRRTLAGLIDLGHFQAFERVTTYTLISLFDARHNENRIEYYSYSPDKREKEYVDSFTYEEMDIEGRFYISSRPNLALMNAVRKANVARYVKVKNGFATLADKVFITDVPFKTLTIPVLKASTGRWHSAFFPYDGQGKPLPKEQIFAHKEIADYLNSRKTELLKGRTEEEKPDWYLYGRTQALKDVAVNKYSINTLISGIPTIKLNEVPAGSGLYSGLYILTDIPLPLIEQAIKSREFIDYLRILKNYKSGGYYTFNSKDLEQYLNYKLSCNEETGNYIPFNERRVLEGCLEFV